MEFLRSANVFRSMGIWTTDYAPHTFDEVIGNEKVRTVLKQYMQSGQLPNIILTGNHGTCKRTFARLIAHNYLGDEYSRGCLPIDGAIYRGKDVIACNNTKKANEKSIMSTQNVLAFARTIVTLKNDRKKLVIIYNFEDMTNEAQNALRRIIETYESNTRFILICNNLDNIIEAIQSRCMSLMTNLLDATESMQLISSLRSRNGMKDLDDEIIRIIIMLSSGDMKKIINYTQTISALDDVDIDTFHRIFNIPPIKVLEQLLKDTMSIDTQPTIMNRLSFLMEQGYTYGDILEMLSKILAYENFIPDKTKFLYLEKLAEYYYQMTQYTHQVHLYALFSEFSEINNNMSTLL
jgi:DNA polymerase III delta prime subunit